MDHILIVEDEPTLRASLLRSLQGQAELAVQGVSTLHEAVLTLDRKRPSLLVLDADISDGSGLELLSELSARNLTIPIIVLAANARQFQVDFADQAHIEVLAKPLEMAEFRRCVWARLSQRSERTTSAFSVSDYLQLAGMARRSVVLSVNEGSRVVGKIVVEEGTPRWAEDQHGAGEPAFRRLALLARAEVYCKPLEAPLGKSNLSGSLEQLLIEAARQADETRRRGPSKAPPTSESARPSDSTLPTRPPSGTSAPSSGPTRVPPPPPIPRPRHVPPPKPAAGIGLGAFATKASGHEAPAQEKVVTLKSLKLDLKNIVELDPSLKGAARSDQQGSVIDLRGELDAETACAVASVALRQIAEATAELGLGRPAAWHISVGNSTWYVTQAREELLVARGALHKNPISTLKKLVKAQGVAT